METQNLKLLLDVARHGSFAAAARARDLDPSSVSRIVALLEAELAIRLFQRTTRRLSLTEAGEVYLRRIEAVIDEMERARDDAQRISAQPAGTLRMTTSVAFGQTCIVPLLPELRQSFPELTLELLMTDANIELVAERVDLAIRLAPNVTGDLICAKLMDTNYRVCASPAYLEAAPPIDAPSELTAHPCLLFALQDYRSRWLFRDRQDSIEEVPVGGTVVISNALALRNAAIAGLGPTLLADWLINSDIAEGRLVDIFPHHQVTATTFETAAWLVYPSRAFLPNKVRVMIDFLRKNFRS